MLKHIGLVVAGGLGLTGILSLFKISITVRFCKTSILSVSIFPAEPHTWIWHKQYESKLYYNKYSSSFKKGLSLNTLYQLP